MSLPKPLVSLVVQLSEETQGLLLLTSREWEVLQAHAAMMTASQIAEQLCVTPKSVDNYKNTICNKLGLHGPKSLLKYTCKYKTEIDQLYGFIKHLLLIKKDL